MKEDLDDEEGGRGGRKGTGREWGNACDVLCFCLECFSSFLPGKAHPLHPSHSVISSVEVALF